MSTLPVILGVSLWLMLGTCSSAAVVKRFLPGYPSQVYRPTFPWENFFKKSNDVSSSEYVDPNEMKELSLDTDGTGDEDQGYDPDDLYDSRSDLRDEPNIEDTDDDVDSAKIDENASDDSDIDDSDIDDSDIDDSEINDSDIDDSDIDDSEINDSDIDDSDTDDSDYNDHNYDHDIDTNVFDNDDIDDSDTDDYDDDDNSIDDDVEYTAQDSLSDHLGYLPVDDEYFKGEHDQPDDDDVILDRDRRALRPWMLKLAPAYYKGMMARTRLLKGAIPTPRRNHGITMHYEKAGGQSAMTKDFYVVQPTKVSDAVIDGHYVGKIGQVGDTRLHYFIHDHEHVELKPFLAIEKMDKYGNIIAKDIIHYMD